MDINNNGFLTVKSRELNRLCKSAQIADKKMYKIRSIDQVFLFLMYIINSSRKTLSLQDNIQYTNLELYYDVKDFTQGLYFLNDLFSGAGLFVNLNLHQISDKMVYNMTILGKTFFLHRIPT